MRLLYQIVSVSYDVWSGGVRYFGGKALDCLFGGAVEFVGCTDEFLAWLESEDPDGP